MPAPAEAQSHPILLAQPLLLLDPPLWRGAQQMQLRQQHSRGPSFCLPSHTVPWVTSPHGAVLYLVLLSIPDLLPEASNFLKVIHRTPEFFSPAFCFWVRVLSET